MQKDEEEEVAGNADDGMLEKRYADRDESGIVMSAVAADRGTDNWACAVSKASAAAIMVVAIMGIGVGLVSTPPG